MVCVCVWGKGGGHIYPLQTDQWRLKRSRADDDGCWLYVLMNFDHGNGLHLETAEQMIGINSLIVLNLPSLIPQEHVW